jgi:hypothetical protein
MLQLPFTAGSGGSNAGSTDLGANQRHYVYLDDSAIITQASPELDADCFLNSTTAPTWSDAKHGFYNGSDKCIFGFVTNASSQIYEFFHDGGDYMSYADSKAGGQTAVTDLDYSAIDVDTTWDDVYLLIPAFATKAECRFSAAYVDGASSLSWRTNGQTGTDGHLVADVNSDYAASTNTATVFSDSSQIIEVVMSASNGNTATVQCEGWYFPTGM